MHEGARSCSGRGGVQGHAAMGFASESGRAGAIMGRCRGGGDIVPPSGGMARPKALAGIWPLTLPRYRGLIADPASPSVCPHRPVVCRIRGRAAAPEAVGAVFRRARPKRSCRCCGAGSEGGWLRTSGYPASPALPAGVGTMGIAQFRVLCPFQTGMILHMAPAETPGTGPVRCRAAWRAGWVRPGWGLRARGGGGSARACPCARRRSWWPRNRAGPW